MVKIYPLTTTQTKTQIKTTEKRDDENQSSFRCGRMESVLNWLM